MPILFRIVWQLLYNRLIYKQMKAKTTYLKGKSIFIVSIIVIAITVLTVYITGINYNRSITSNLYLSLSIIGAALFLFITYGLYKGIGLIDNFPAFKNFKLKESITSSSSFTDFPDIAIAEGILGILISIVLWIAMSIAFTLLLIFIEAFFWFSIFILLGMLYWVFFRALKLVFSKVKQTKGNLLLSVKNALSYTALYLGWLFAIVYITEQLR